MRRRFAITLMGAAVALATGAACADAAVTFKTPVSYAAQSGTADVAVGDFNEDGKTDLVTANQTDSSFSVLLGNGDGTFQAQVRYAVATGGPTRVAVADFDGDHHQDLALAIAGTNRAVVEWGIGNGSFTLTPAVVTTLGTPGGVGGADLGLGRDQLLTTNPGGTQLSINTADPLTRTFGSATNVVVGNGPDAIASGDLYGETDVVTTFPSTGSLRFERSDGAGGLQAGQGGSYGVGSPPINGGNPTDVAVADLTGDGKGDMVTSNSGTTTATILPSRPSNVTAQQNTALPAGSVPTGIATGDVTGDGLADAIVVDSGLDQVTVLKGGAPGVLTPMTIVGSYPAGTGTNRDASADFNGDGAADLAVSSTSSGGEVHVLMSRGAPTLAGQASASVVVGGQLSDTVTLAGGTPNATGTITWDLYGPGDTTCTTSLSHQTSTVSGMADHTTPTPFTSAHAGTYRWVASYSGDGNNAGVTGTCADANQTTSVTKAVTSVSASATSSIVLGAGAPASATLSGGHSATGSITFKAYATSDCSGSPAYTSDPAAVSGNGSYDASPTFTPGSAGTYRWVASYGGDGDNQSATSTCGAGGSTTDVAPAITSTTVSASGPVVVGHTLAISANLSGGHSPIGGTITFSAYAGASCAGPPVHSSTATVSGAGPYQPSAVFQPSSAGTYSVRAVYGGDANNLGSTSSCSSPAQVDKATPSVAASAPATIGLGDADPAHADLSGTFSGGGTVTFRAYANAACSGTPASTSNPVAVSGDGSYAATPVFTPSTAGTYRWVASYSGDANNEAAASACGASGTVTTVDPFAPTLSGTATSATLGAAVQDTATLTGATAHAGGTLTFRAFATGDCTGTPAFTSAPVAVDGSGQYGSGPFTPGATGEYRWTVAYSGDTDNAPTSTLCGTAGQTSTITQAALTVDPPRLDFGQVTIGRPSARTVTVTNSSAGATAEPATIGKLVLSGTGYGFLADACSTVTLAPGASCSFSLGFDPAAPGAASGSVSIPSNAAGSPATVALSGSAVAAPVALTNIASTRCLGTAPGARKAVTIAYTVSQPARVTFTLQRRVKPAHDVRSSCPKTLPAAVPGDYVDVRRATSSARATARARTTVLATTVSVGAGAHVFKLSTLLAGTTLKPGRFRVQIKAVTAQGATAQNAAYFWVLKPKRTSRR